MEILSMEKTEPADHLKQSRRTFIKIGTGLLSGLALNQNLETLGAPSIPAADLTGRRPNLVVFLGEGLRYDEMSCVGHPIVKTPNMDRIAREGMTFANSFTT